MNYDKEYFVKLLEKLVLPLKQHYSPKGANLSAGKVKVCTLRLIR